MESRKPSQDDAILNIFDMFHSRRTKEGKKKKKKKKVSKRDRRSRIIINGIVSTFFITPHLYGVLAFSRAPNIAFTSIMRHRGRDEIQPLV